MACYAKGLEKLRSALVLSRKEYARKEHVQSVAFLSKSLTEQELFFVIGASLSMPRGMADETSDF